MYGGSSKKKKKRKIGNSLEVQWVGLGTFTAMGLGAIPGRELSFHKQRSVAIKNKTKQTKQKKRKKKPKNRVATELSISTPGNISGQKSNSKRHMHPTVHSSSIHNSQEMEAT